jgi:uncharacterized protein YndB with AHSA1/START domain
MARTSIVIDRPVHDVFARVTDLERAREWAPQMGTMKLDGPLREGMTMLEERRFLGRTVNATWEITRLDPDRVLALGLRFGPLRGRFSYEFEPQGSGTRVTQSTDIGFAGPLRIFSPLIAGEAQREEDAELVRLKALLERQA